MKTTRKTIQELVNSGAATDITSYSAEECYKLAKIECGLNEIMYSVGTYGRNGRIMQGRITGTLYAITARSTAIFAIS